MDNGKTLNPDEVMCLMMAGMASDKIRRTDLDAFDALYNEHPEWDEYLDKANSILDRQERLGIVTITCQDNDFPARLKGIGNDCPPLIHCLGNPALLAKYEAVAVIGARNCSRQGFDKAYRLGKEYAEQGCVVVSGLALGCDTAAHRGCLAAGGDTIAIVGSGLDIVHPHESVPLQKEILAAGGLILSEQTIGTKANPSRLVARNRLQAALSQSVILAECPAQSGSLHTMRFARKYGQESLAATYPQRTDANAGNYDLIDQGLAKPI